MNNDMLKNMLIWAVAAMVLMSVFNHFSGQGSAASSRIDYSDFIDQIHQGQVSKVSIEGPTIRGVYVNGGAFTTYSPGDPGLMGDLLDNHVKVSAKPPEKQSILMQIFISWFPMLLLIGVWIFFMKSMGGGMGGKGGPMSFGKSKAKMLTDEQIKVTLDDVAGADEAKQEVAEVVDFLRDPGKYQNLGGNIPRGILMIGPPGTGKTLLAKAIAGEAKVPFFTISGSDFVEMFVGVGASRVRDMFEQAKAHAPCIIFIDEIDAVGRSRGGSGMGGGNDEREQTLNQLLVEMDGFEGNEGVIVIAATNRADVLDSALLRPGRFDRQVTVGLPDIKGREQILKVHMRKVPLSDDVKPAYIARGTPGFSGADLANLVNEAALFAARNNDKLVTQKHFEQAKDKILMGVERKSMIMSEKERRMTAYHEAGHAIVGCLVPEHDPVYKVSIMPRGRALGVTMYLPEEDAYSYSKQKLESQLSSLYGGRVAEELIYGSDLVTTGASNDIERATAIARNMVTKWGLSEALGPLMYEDEESAGFMGHSRNANVSEEVSRLIDAEMRKLIDRNYKRAQDLLKEHADKLEIMTDTLMEFETIDAAQIKNIMEGLPPGKPKDWEDSEVDDSDASSGESTEEKSKKSATDETVSDDMSGEHDSEQGEPKLH